MTNASTVNKLVEMRLTAMADAFRIQKDDPSMREVPFEDRFGMLVDIEYSSRKNNRLKRLIRNAGFEQPDASVVTIDYQSGRNLYGLCLWNGSVQEVLYSSVRPAPGSSS